MQQTTTEVPITIAKAMKVALRECERSFSTLRRLKTWTHCTMETDGLGTLAHMNVHYSHEVSYARVSPRKSELLRHFLELFKINYSCVHMSDKYVYFPDSME